MSEASGSGTQDTHTMHSDAISVFSTRITEHTVVGSSRRTSTNEYVQLRGTTADPALWAFLWIVALADELVASIAIYPYQSGISWAVLWFDRRTQP